MVILEFQVRGAYKSHNMLSMRALKQVSADYCTGGKQKEISLDGSCLNPWVSYFTPLFDQVNIVVKVYLRNIISLTFVCLKRHQ